MNRLGSVIAAVFEREQGSSFRLERDVFATADPARIAAMVDAFCRLHFGVGVARYEFFASSVGSVHGLRLEDGRRVVVKAHRAGVDTEHLAAVQTAQSRLAAAGFPAPLPILPQTRLGSGVAVVETLLDEGGRADAHEPAVRRLTAGTLARLVELCRPLRGLAGLESSRVVAERLWRVPHDRRFDFTATARGAAWIDRLAAAARSRLDDCGAGELVLGHGDWRVEHLRFAERQVSAVYDWDSLNVGAEPGFVGSAAHAFTADWSIAGLRCVPTLAEAQAFIADYEAARGRPFTAEERGTAEAALVHAVSYSARCEHSDALTGFGTHEPDAAPPAVPAGGFRAFLARHGADLLGVSAAGVPPVGGHADSSPPQEAR